MVSSELNPRVSTLQEPQGSRASTTERADEGGSVVGSRKRPTFGGIVSGLIISLIGLVIVAAVIVPRILGAVPLTVLTGSMTPTYRPGDIVVVQPVPAEELVIGDVVTFQAVSGDPRLTTHRIVDIERAGNTVTSVITRGDANNSDDAPIIPDQIQGRVRYSVPFVGRLANTRSAVLVGGTLIGGGFLFYTASQVLQHLKTRKQEQSI